MLSFCKALLPANGTWVNTLLSHAFPKINCSREPKIKSLSKRLDAYTLRDKLGEGASGEVWVAETALNGDERALVSVKVVRRDKLDSDGISAIHNELELTRFLTHTDPSLGLFPQLVESFTDVNNFYIVQEYLPGGTLRDELNRFGGKLPANRAFFVLCQLITIVHRMHMLGVMHRDINPENILLDAVGNVTLADFGLAHWVSNVVETSEGFVPTGNTLTTNKPWGTLQYAAPEKVFGEYYSYPVDVYSLGVIFYEMVLGYRPYQRYEATNNVAYGMLHDTIRLPVNHLTKDAQDVVELLLARDASDRIGLEQLMAHRFFDIVDWQALIYRTDKLPVEWAPPISPINREKEVGKSVLVDRTRTRKVVGRHSLPALDGEFTTSFRAPTVIRPALPTLREIQLDAIRRGTAQAISQSPVVSSPQPASSLQTEADMENETDTVQVDFLGEVVDKLTMYACLSPMTVSADTTPVDTTDNAPPLTATSVSTHSMSRYSVFNVSIEPLDEILLSTLPSMGSRRAFAFQVSSPSPSPLIADLATSQIIMTNCISSPIFASFYGSWPSPSITPSPIMSASISSQTAELEFCE